MKTERRIICDGLYIREKRNYRYSNITIIVVDCVVYLYCVCVCVCACAAASQCENTSLSSYHHSINRHRAKLLFSNNKSDRYCSVGNVQKAKRAFGFVKRIKLIHSDDLYTSN